MPQPSAAAPALTSAVLRAEPGSLVDVICTRLYSFMRSSLHTQGLSLDLPSSGSELLLAHGNVTLSLVYTSDSHLTQQVGGSWLQQPHLEVASLTPLQETSLLTFTALWCGVTHRPVIAWSNTMGVWGHVSLVASLWG